MHTLHSDRLSRPARDACAVSDGFMRCRAEPLPGAPQLSCMLGRFWPAQYGAALYQRHAPAFPAAIQRSVAKRQAEFLAGRMCAQAALGGIGHARYSVAIGAHGEPLWPEGVAGSITHSGTFAAAVACRSDGVHGIGIDIEAVAGPDGGRAIAALAVSARELDCLQAGGAGPGLDCLLTLAFSAKESLYKAVFSEVRKFLDFDSAELVGIDPARRQLRFRCMQALGARLPAGAWVLAHSVLLDPATVLSAVILDGAAARK